MINTEDTLYPKDKPLSENTIQINDEYFNKLADVHLSLSNFYISNIVNKDKMLDDYINKILT